MKTLKESILDQDDLDMGVEVTAVMNKIVRWYFEKDKYQYELKGHTMHIKTWFSAPRLDNEFLDSMRQLKVNKIVWNVTKCTPRLYGDWNIDTDILNGSIVICCKSMSCKLNCDGAMGIQNPTIFKNTQMQGKSLCVDYGNLLEFKGNSKIYVPDIRVRGEYITDYKKVRDNLFLNELEKIGVISINNWGQISAHFDKGDGLTLNKLCGKVFPNAKEISMIQIHGTGLYIGKDFKYKDWGYGWEELKMKDGNSLWIGRQN